jgi:hypothetical protein
MLVLTASLKIQNPKMIYIFLDTNIFFNNWYLTSAEFRFLFNYIENTNSVLLLSELVCEEVENIRNRELESIVHNLKQELKKTKKLNSTLLEYDFDKLFDETYNFKEIVQNKVSSIQFIQYQNIGQNEVVRRALKKVRPFQEEEKGYRDTLIWLSFLSFLSTKEIKNEVIFITNNKNDFYNKNNNDFHNDLKLDIENYMLKCKIKTYTSLFNFIENNVDKEVHEFNRYELFDDHLNNIDSELEVEAISFINNYSENKFKEILDNNQLRTFPYINSIISHSIELMEGVEDPEILTYKKLTKNTIYVGFRYNLRICILNFTIPNSDYNTNRQYIDKLYCEIISDENLTYFSSYVRTFLDVSFEYNMDSGTIDGYNIETIDFK